MTEAETLLKEMVEVGMLEAHYGGYAQNEEGCEQYHKDCEEIAERKTPALVKARQYLDKIGAWR